MLSFSLKSPNKTLSIKKCRSLDKNSYSHIQHVLSEFTKKGPAKSEENQQSEQEEPQKPKETKKFDSEVENKIKSLDN